MDKTAGIRPSARLVGVEGEMYAAFALQKKGLRVVARNSRSQYGEIDLIALDGEFLAFIEVKTWPAHGLENLSYGITRKKQQRIIETAKYFLAMHQEYCNKSIRFDVIYLHPGESMVHLVSAFTES
ncbi:MAG: YraN family protein [Spirochaetaceae bacterium]|jgi:putative endonuclease|nr:YraN family protein [Spirochaetaceae bacterium]